MENETIKLLKKIRNKYVDIQQKNTRLDFISDDFVDWLDEKISEEYLRQ